jgi:hypothetical protein
MGLRGAGARSRKVDEQNLKLRPRALPWKKPGLSRVERVLAFLESLPITKGILAGTKMKLLPGQLWVKSDIEARPSDVRFTPKSGHRSVSF